MFQQTIPLPEKALCEMKAYYGTTFLKWNWPLFISSRRTLISSSSGATLHYSERALHVSSLHMFDCNLLCANTISLVVHTWNATNDTRWIGNIKINIHQRELRARGCWLKARNRTWLVEKCTNRDLSDFFPLLLCFFSPRLVKSNPIMFWQNFIKYFLLAQQGFMGS